MNKIFDANKTLHETEREVLKYCDELPDTCSEDVSLISIITVYMPKFNFIKFLASLISKTYNNFKLKR